MSNPDTTWCHIYMRIVCLFDACQMEVALMDDVVVDELN